MSFKKIPAILLALSVISGIICSACEKKKVNSLRTSARDLYLKSVSLSSKYIDSIGNAPDSTALLDLMRRYDSETTHLNYSFPPGTDYELAEGENDTLKTLSDRIIFLRDSLLYAYAHPLLPDTIPIETPDSIQSPL